MNFRLPHRRLPVLAALLIFALPSFVHAATLNVPSSAYPTIQSGINAAQSGDTVLVADGTYMGDGNRDLDFNGKSLTVTSQHGAAKTIINCGGYSSTDGSGNHRGFYIHSGETKAVVSGFTVEGGYERYTSNITDSGYGGGICIENSSVTVQNCTVTGNGGGFNGGGIFSYNDNSGNTITMTNCIVTGNTAGNGGGVYNENDNSNYSSGSNTITMTNCTVTGNTAGNGGGVYNNNFNGNVSSGVYHHNNSNTITMAGCTVTGNGAGYTIYSGIGGSGGGIFSYNQNGYNNLSGNGSSGSNTITITNCTVTGNGAVYSGGGVYNGNGNYSGGSNTIALTNCTVIGNTAGDGSGVYNDNYNGNGSNGINTITFTNCVLYNDIGTSAGSEVYNNPNDNTNISLTYSDIQGGYPGTGNIDKDPLFVRNPNPTATPANYGDLHLKPGSPCLGKGSPSDAPATDKDGRTRPSLPSMGAYELTETFEIPAQYPTIQSAVVASHSGDTVMVAAGTYTGPGNVDWDFGGKDITVQSANGATNTIIDCGGKPSTDGSGNHRGFYLHSGETNAVIDGFTVKNGYTSSVAGVTDSGYGGSICIDSSSASIKNCVFSGSTATVGGGGVAIIGKGHHSITLTNCVFIKNTAPNGGGTYILNDSGKISLTSCTLTGNTAQYGGGSYNRNRADSGIITQTGCLIVDNTALNGSGSFSENEGNGDTIALINCSVSGNASPFGSAIYNFNNTANDTIMTCTPKTVPIAK